MRAFGGMKIPRTWFAADKTGFHMLHTLFQTSIKYPSIKRFDEHVITSYSIHYTKLYERSLGRCRGPAATLARDPLLSPARRAIVDTEVMAGPLQMGRHWRAHHAQADECEFHAEFSPLPELIFVRTD